MSHSTNKVRYNGLIEEDILETFKKLAKKDRRNLNSLLNKLIEDFCEEQTRKSA